MPLLSRCPHAATAHTWSGQGLAFLFRGAAKRIETCSLPFVTKTSDIFVPVVQSQVVPARTNRRLRLPLAKGARPRPSDRRCEGGLPRMCLASGRALRWLKDQPKAFHHLDLRARVAEHLAGHKEDYEPAWSSDAILVLMAQPCLSRMRSLPKSLCQVSTMAKPSSRLCAGSSPFGSLSFPAMHPLNKRRPF